MLLKSPKVIHFLNSLRKARLIISIAPTAIEANFPLVIPVTTASTAFFAVVKCNPRTDPIDAEAADIAIDVLSTLKFSVFPDFSLSKLYCFFCDA